MTHKGTKQTIVRDAQNALGPPRGLNSKASYKVGQRRKAKSALIIKAQLYQPLGVNSSFLEGTGQLVLFSSLGSNSGARYFSGGKNSLINGCGSQSRLWTWWQSIANI